jgi:hypothetical protein
MMLSSSSSSHHHQQLHYYYYYNYFFPSQINDLCSSKHIGAYLATRILRTDATADCRNHLHLRGSTVLIRWLDNSTRIWETWGGGVWQCELCGRGNAGPSHTVATYTTCSLHPTALFPLAHTLFELW